MLEDDLPSIVLQPPLHLDVYRYPNITEILNSKYDDDDDIDEMEGDIDDVDDEKIIRNPFDWTRMKRHYVAYLGHLPNSVTEVPTI